MTEPVNPTPVPALATEFPDAGDLDTFDVRAAALFQYLTGTLAPGANTIAEQAYTNALSAQEFAVVAYLNANYKGAWSALTGTLAVPSLVSHAGERWSLLNGLADVTASEPGVSADWELFSLPSALGVGFDPTGTSLSETNVQAALSAVSAAADEALVDFVNPVVNGAMRIAQAGTSFALTTGTSKTLDGCGYAAAGSSAVTVSQQSAATPDNPNAKWMIATVTTADTSIASSDYSLLTCLLEGFDVAEYRGKTFTLGFVVKSSVTGAHSVALLNEAQDMRYIASFNISAANTPQFVSVTIAGGIPESGTWNYGSGVGLRINFALAAGSIHQSTTGAWASGGQFASSSQVNAVGTIGNVFGVSEVQINPGAVAKRFKMPAYQADLARCQRYYESLDVQVGENTQASTKGNGYGWKVEKRIAPTLTVSDGIGPLSTAVVSFSPGALGTSKSTIYQSTGTDIGTLGAMGHKIVVGDARM